MQLHKILLILQMPLPISTCAALYVAAFRPKSTRAVRNVPKQLSKQQSTIFHCVQVAIETSSFLPYTKTPNICSWKLLGATSSEHTNASFPKYIIFGPEDRQNPPKAQQKSPETPQESAHRPPPASDRLPMAGSQPTQGWLGPLLQGNVQCAFRTPAHSTGRPAAGHDLGAVHTASQRLLPACPMHARMGGLTPLPYVYYQLVHKNSFLQLLQARACNISEAPRCIPGPDFRQIGNNWLDH